MADNDGFQFVKKKGRGRHRNTRIPHRDPQSNCDNSSDDVFDLTAFKRRLDNCVQEMRLSGFFEAAFEMIVDAISKVAEQKRLEVNCTGEIHSDNLSKSTQNSRDNVELLSYGIGNFTTCPIARYQLSFLIVLREKLQDKCTSCSVYDPMFSKNDLEVLDKIDFSVIAENEEGKRQCSVPTVAFMPHCGKALYNNFVWKNLHSGPDCTLRNVILIGNSFSRMIERTPKSVLMATGNYIIKMADYTQEVSLPSNTSHSDVFNDLSVHTFPRSKLNDIPGDFWDDLAEPQYTDEDVEFIRK